MENALDHILGAPVGVGDPADLHILGKGDNVVHAVHCGRGTEDDLFAAVVAHHIQQYQGAVYIVIKVFQRLVYALAHGLQPGKVNDAVNVLCLKDFVQTLSVPNVAFVELKVTIHQRADPIQRRVLAVVKIIQDYHILACVD